MRSLLRVEEALTSLAPKGSWATDTWHGVGLVVLGTVCWNIFGFAVGAGAAGFYSNMSGAG